MDSEDAQRIHINIDFIAGSSKFSTMPLSILLTKLLTHIKQGLLEELRDSLLKKWGQSDVDPQEFKGLLDNLKSANSNFISNNKSFDFSTRYTPFLARNFKAG